MGRKQNLEWAENSAFVEQRISSFIKKKMRFGSAVACSVTVLLGELTLHARDRLFVYFRVMVDGNKMDMI